MANLLPEVHREPEQRQRPTVFVSRVTPSIIQLPERVVEYQKLSRSEQLLQIRSPHELAVMVMRCYGCKKPILQVQIEQGLRSGKTLRQVLDDLDYIRICCRKQIQEEPAIVYIQKQQAEITKVKEKMENLSIFNTGLSVNWAPSETGAQIVNEAPPGVIQSSVLLTRLEDFSPSSADPNCFTALNESFVEEPTSVNEFEDDDDDED